MREVLSELTAIRDSGGRAAMATVVRTWRSAPRPAGASMLVSDAGEAVGSVSGGCVEGALYELGQEVLADGQPRYETYGVSDDDAFAVGLTCGGILEVFVERVDDETWPELDGVARSIATEEPVAVATIVRGPHHVGRHLVVRPDHTEGSLGTDRLDDTVREDVIGMLASGTTGFLHYGPEGERLGEGLDVFVASYAPPPQMFIFGAIDFSAALVKVGKVLGFRVTVCDARPVFATRKRFPDADDVVVDWPHRWLEQQHDRSAHGHRRPDARSQVRRARAHRRPAHRRGVRRRHGLTAHPRGSPGAAQGGRPHGRRARPAALADRARPRCAHAGGDRHLDRRRDRAGPMGRQRPPSREHRRADPPRRSPVIR